MTTWLAASLGLNNERVKVNFAVLGYYRDAVSAGLFGCGRGCGWSRVGFWVIPEGLQPFVKTGKPVVRKSASLSAFVRFHMVSGVLSLATLDLCLFRAGLAKSMAGGGETGVKGLAGDFLPRGRFGPRLGD